MPDSNGERIRELEKKRHELNARLAEVGDMRPGSLVGRFRKCGKPNCRCARAGASGHGPSWSLTKAVGGKTVTKIIPTGVAVGQTKSQIAEYKRFRMLMHDLVDISEQLCDARLSQPEAVSQEAAKKGGSKRPSPPKSSPRSKRS